MKATALKQRPDAPRHHLTDRVIAAYAAGTLPEAFSLVVASHVSLCDDCRAAVAAAEAVGGAVLDRVDEVRMDPGALDAVLARLGAAPEALPKPAPRATGVFPEPLRAYVGGDLDAVRWKRVGGGVKQAVLAQADGASVRLLSIPGGQAMPEHGHGGLELTLVLQGAFADGDERFQRGDVETEDATDQHVPVAEPGQTCICLAATDAPLRFTSFLPRLVQPFVRI
jgi:putative transcriptional regulator